MNSRIFGIYSETAFSSSCWIPRVSCGPWI